MTFATKIWNHPIFFWVLLSLPSIGMIIQFFNPEARYGGLMHGSGEFSARFLVIALLITPLMLFSGGKAWARWLLRRRRYIGIAAFGYALLHTLFYLEHEGLSGALGEWSQWAILTGWLAFLIFVPLTLTSNDWSLRKMGPRWKTLQQGVYAAAVFTLLHWGLVGHWPPALVHAVPVVLLTAYRIYRRYKRNQPALSVPSEGVSGSH